MSSSIRVSTQGPFETIADPSTGSQVTRGITPDQWGLNDAGMPIFETTGNIPATSRLFLVASAGRLDRVTAPINTVEIDTHAGPIHNNLDGQPVIHGLVVDQWGIDSLGAYITPAGTPGTDRAYLTLDGNGMPVLTGVPEAVMMLLEAGVRVYRRGENGRLTPARALRPARARMYTRQTRRRPTVVRASIYPVPARHRRGQPSIIVPSTYVGRDYHRLDDGRLMIHAPIHAPRPARQETR